MKHVNYYFLITLLIGLVTVGNSYDTQAQEAAQKTACSGKKDLNRPFLGVYLLSPDENTQKTDKGLYVDGTAAKGAAEMAGLQAGDIITTINGTTVNSKEEIGAAFKSLKVGDKIELGYLRAENAMTSSAVLGNYADHAKTAASCSKGGAKTASSCSKSSKESCKKSSAAACSGKSKDLANRPFLGIVADVMNEELATAKSLKMSEGLYLNEVYVNSAAAAAGLKVGDIVTAINGETTATMDALVKQLSGAKIGDKLAVLYIRSGEKNDTEATLKARTPEQMASSCSKSKSSCSKSAAKSACTKSASSCSKSAAKSACSKSKSACSSKKMEPNAPILGVNLAELSEVEEEKRGEETTGLYVGKVVPKSGAAQAGLQVGDVIYKVNKTNITGFDNWKTAMTGAKVGDELKIKYKRAGKKKKGKAALMAANKLYPSMFAKKGGCCASKTKSACSKSKKAATELKAPAAVDAKALNVSIIDADMEELKEMMEKNEEVAKTKDMGQLELKDLAFFPNPNAGKFTLEFSPNAEVKTATNIRILDVSGKIIYTEELTNSSDKYTQDIDISNNNKGLYLLQIMQDDKVLTKKILMQ